MTFIPSSRYDNIPKLEFKDQLNALTKKSFFKDRYLIATKDGGLKTTNFFELAWETVWKTTNSSLVELRVMQLLKGGSKVVEKEDLDLIRDLAQRVGLTPMTEEEHRPLQELIEEVSSSILSPKEDIQDRCTQLINRYATEKSEKLEKLDTRMKAIMGQTLPPQQIQQQTIVSPQNRSNSKETARDQAQEESSNELDLAHQQEEFSGHKDAKAGDDQHALTRGPDVQDPATLSIHALSPSEEPSANPLNDRKVKSLTSAEMQKKKQTKGRSWTQTAFKCLKIALGVGLVAAAAVHLERYGQSSPDIGPSPTPSPTPGPTEVGPTFPPSPTLPPLGSRDVTALNQGCILGGEASSSLLNLSFVPQTRTFNDDLGVLNGRDALPLESEDDLGDSDEETSPSSSSSTTQIEDDIGFSNPAKQDGAPSYSLKAIAVAISGVAIGAIACVRRFCAPKKRSGVPVRISPAATEQLSSFANVLAAISNDSAASIDDQAKRLHHVHKEIVKAMQKKEGWFKTDQQELEQQELGKLASKYIDALARVQPVNVEQFVENLEREKENALRIPRGKMNLQQIQDLILLVRCVPSKTSFKNVKWRVSPEMLDNANCRSTSGKKADIDAYAQDLAYDAAFKQSYTAVVAMCGRIIKELHTAEEGSRKAQLETLMSECWLALAQTFTETYQELSYFGELLRDNDMTSYLGSVTPDTLYCGRNPLIHPVRSQELMMEELYEYVSARFQSDAPELFKDGIKMNGMGRRMMHEMQKNGVDVSRKNESIFLKSYVLSFLGVVAEHRREGKILPQARDALLVKIEDAKKECRDFPNFLPLFNHMKEVISELPEDTTTLSALGPLIEDIRKRHNSEEDKKFGRGLVKAAQTFQPPKDQSGVEPGFPSFYHTGLKQLAFDTQHSQHGPCKHYQYPQLLYILTRLTKPDCEALSLVDLVRALETVVSKIGKAGDVIAPKDISLGGNQPWTLNAEDIAMMEQAVVVTYDCLMETLKNWPRAMATDPYAAPAVPLLDGGDGSEDETKELTDFRRRLLQRNDPGDGGDGNAADSTPFSTPLNPKQQQEYTEIVENLVRNINGSLISLHRELSREIDKRNRPRLLRKPDPVVTEELVLFANRLLDTIVSQSEKTTLDKLDKEVDAILSNPSKGGEFEQIQQLKVIARILISNKNEITAQNDIKAYGIVGRIFKKALADGKIAGSKFLKQQFESLAVECWHGIIQIIISRQPDKLFLHLFDNEVGIEANNSMYKGKNPEIYQIRERLHDFTRDALVYAMEKSPMKTEINFLLRNNEVVFAWMIAVAHKKDGSILYKARNSLLQHMENIRETLNDHPGLLLLFDYTKQMLENLPDNTEIDERVNKMIDSIRSKNNGQDFKGIRDRLVQESATTMRRTGVSPLSFSNSGLRKLTDKLPCKHPLYPELHYLLIRFTDKQATKPISLHEVMTRVLEIYEKIEVRDEDFQKLEATDEDIRYAENVILTICECYQAALKTWPQMQAVAFQGDNSGGGGQAGPADERKENRLKASKGAAGTVVANKPS